MKNTRCWCSNYCHHCERRDVPLYLCRGCGHRFCYCCAHRLEVGALCGGCMSIWLNVMTSFDLPYEVAYWFNQITL